MTTQQRTVLQCAANNTRSDISRAMQQLREKAQRDGYRLGEIQIEWNHGKAHRHPQCPTHS